MVLLLQEEYVIIMNKNVKCKITEVISHTEGRWLICSLKTEERQFSLVSIYAPNMDDPSFLKQLLKLKTKIWKIL